MKSKLVIRAGLDALGVVAYVGLFTWLVGHAQNFFGTQPQWWLGATLFLMFFIVSASVTGSLVLLAPILAYVDGRKKEALQLFFATLAFLALIALVVALVLVIR